RQPFERVRPRRAVLVGHAYAARPHPRSRLEGKPRARAQADPANGFRLAADQHGDRTSAQRPSGAILRSGGIACAADRSPHARGVAGRGALTVAPRPAVAGPTEIRFYFFFAS